ncbi:MAG TPA: EamA family transporter [Ignavibacteriaceae bacterium]|nr:EamA family transporter [Ignavibacteriaceae bacterium]
MQKSTIKIILIYAVACMMWGSTWMAIRVSLNSLTPFVSCGLRFLLASFFVIALVKIRGIKIQTDKLSMTLYLVMGLFSFVIPFGLVYWGEQYVPSGLASVLFAVNPFFVAIFSYYFIVNENVGAHKIIGIVLGFAGILIIFSENILGDIKIYIPGMLAIIGSAIMQGGLQVTMKKHGGHLNPLSMNFLPMLFAGVVMLGFGLLVEDTSRLVFDLSAYLSVGYLAFFGSLVTFTSYYWLLKRVSVVVLSLIAFITPIIALILGWVFLDEELSSRHVIGSLIVLTGLLIAILGNFRSLKKIKLLKKQAV